MSGEQLAEPIRKCIAICKAARNDSERFSAVFLFTKLLRSKDCTSEAKRQFFEAVSFEFLRRLLLTKDVPVNCPPEIYKSVALSMLANFTQEESLATHPDVLKNLSILLDIVKAGDSNADQSLMALDDTYKVLKNIVMFERGQEALWRASTVEIMSEIYSQQSFHMDKALEIVVGIVARYGIEAWSKNIEQFHTFMGKLAMDFETDHTERKFQLCKSINSIVYHSASNGKQAIVESLKSDAAWSDSVHKSLSDILRGKIAKKQRDPALFLLSTMINVLSIDWLVPPAFALLPINEDASGVRNEAEDKYRKFFLLVVQLTAVEIRMQIDEKQVDNLMNDAEIIVACFLILESALNHITCELIEFDQKDKQSTYTALKSAFTSVANLLEKLANAQASRTFTEIENKFIYAIIRALIAWLVQEPTALRPQIYKLLPYLLRMANQSFEEAKPAYAKLKENQDINMDFKSITDILRVFLAALCHLTVEDQSRRILLEMKEDERLFECLQLHWSIVHYKKPPVPRAERLKQLQNPNDRPLSKALKDQQQDSRTAIISICNIFMNITVLESKRVQESELFRKLLEFLFENLAELKNSAENLVLLGNMAVLGLLLMKEQTNRVKKNDFSICRYIQVTIRFLWDAWSSCDESVDPATLVVSLNYRESWNELMQLWFLGMQTLSAVLAVQPWISEFALESGWVEGIVQLLANVRVGNLQTNVKMAFEDFLCHLYDANADNFKKVLKMAQVQSVCKTHRLQQLSKKLSGSTKAADDA